MTSRVSQRTAFGIKILNSHHKDIRRIKRDGHAAEIHGNKFWNSSFLVMDYLKKNPLKRRARVLEVGCGWGLLGVFCAKRYDARVVGIDADEHVLPFLDLHAKINKVKIKGRKMSFQQLTVANLKNYDVILGADICFWDEMTSGLYNLISRAKKAGVKQVVIADPCRQPFTDLVERCKKKYDDIEVVEKWLKHPVHTSGEILIIR